MIIEMRLVWDFLGDDFKQSEEFVSKMFNIFTSTGKYVDRKKTLKIQPIFFAWNRRCVFGGAGVSFGRTEQKLAPSLSLQHLRSC